MKFVRRKSFDTHGPRFWNGGRVLIFCHANHSSCPNALILDRAGRRTRLAVTSQPSDNTSRCLRSNPSPRSGKSFPATCSARRCIRARSITCQLMCMLVDIVATTKNENFTHPALTGNISTQRVKGSCVHDDGLSSHFFTTFTLGG